MGRISFSKEEKNIESIWGWYEDQKEALRDFKNKIIQGLISLNDISINNKYYSFTQAELDLYFDDSEKELDYLVSFDLIAATEAFLKIDFHLKVLNKDKSDLGRTFRKLHKVKGSKISLEDDIIENWKIYSANKKSFWGDFIGLLNYRNWLAHGRYWTPKLGRKYTPDVIYGYVENILKIVSNQ